MFGWGIKSITTDQLPESLDSAGAVLIDVREPHEFAAGHVPGAVNIPLGQLTGRLGAFDPSAPTYVICQSGRRSREAVKRLKRAGFSDAYNVAGGTSAWSGMLEK